MTAPSRLAPLALVLALAAPAVAAEDAAPRVALETSKGTIVLELDPRMAPRTVESFLAYVESGYYDGTIFHRVIPGFMAQAGGFTPDLQLKPTDRTIPNEADNGLRNIRGSIAMARRPDPHSASSQFFINVVDNPRLDHVDKSAGGWGYAVFGRVVEGMEVVDMIVAMPRGQRGAMGDVPDVPIVIESARVVGAETQ